MRTALLILTGFISFAPVRAETQVHPRAQRSAPAKVAPPKSMSGANACAAYGAGFVRVEGTGTCVKIGGAIGVGVSASPGR